MSNYLRRQAPWIPSTWINKVVGVDAFQTEEGVKEPDDGQTPA